MKFSIIIILSFIFCSLDSSKNHIPSNYFKNLKLKTLKMNPEDILNTQSIGQDKLFLSQRQIDSIKVISQKFIPSPVSEKDTILIETNKGAMKLIYYPSLAPKHCYNFKKLANSGFYDNTKFHRVIKNFMIQGGDILSRDSQPSNDGTGDPGWNIEQEFSNPKHKKGILSMARGGDPNSAGSQFFICHRDAPWLDGAYTIFGKVVENIHVVDLIAQTPTGYTTAKMNCLSSIPKNEDPDKWIKIHDPKTRELLYSKIPEGDNKIEYKESLMSSLRSDNPTASVIIKKIRVVSGQ